MIIVCPLNKAETLVTEHGASHAVSLLAPGTPHPVFSAMAPECHLRLTFHDIVEPMDGHSPPGVADAEQLISFLSGWSREAPLLIHCWAGISRSTAAAYVALCQLQPEANEEELAWDLRLASRSATPNRLIVSLADALLGRKGRMEDAIAQIGQGEDAFEGEPFILNLAK
jgi:predicted protein tyrosine phosphatase